MIVSHQMLLSGYAGADLRAGAVPGGVRQGGGHLPHLALPLQAPAQPWHARQQIHQRPDVSQCFLLLVFTLKGQ